MKFCRRNLTGHRSGHARRGLSEEGEKPGMGWPQIRRLDSGKRIAEEVARKFVCAVVPPGCQGAGLTALTDILSALIIRSAEVAGIVDRRLAVLRPRADANTSTAQQR